MAGGDDHAVRVNDDIQMPRFHYFEPQTPRFAPGHLVQASFIEVDDFAAEMVELATPIHEKAVEHTAVDASLLHADFSVRSEQNAPSRGVDTAQGDSWVGMYNDLRK